MDRSSFSPLKITVGQIRRDLEGNNNPQAVAFLRAVKSLPDTRQMVVGIVEYNAAKLQEPQDERASGYEGKEVERKS